MEHLAERLKLMVKTIRRESYRALQSERTTVAGAEGMLTVLQLAMAQVNKQHGREFKVALSDVLIVWKHLLLDKLHLPPPSFARLENYDLILEAYEAFLKRSNTVDLADIFSMYKQLGLLPMDPEMHVRPIQLFEFLLGNREAWDPTASSVPSTACIEAGPCTSQVKTATRRVFCSYLSLLVNSKDDLALALTLDAPSRSLGRQALADIKRAARAGNTSLFLAVTSFVRAVQLGGKGYAPAESDPLRKHVTGLCDFVHFVDSLEEILGETPEPSACGARLVAAIRSALVKGRGGGDAARAAAEETADELKERICQLHRIHAQTVGGGGTGISPARPKAYAVNRATALGGRETVKVLTAMLDEEALAPPRQNKAELLLEDQPVLSGAEGSCVLALFRSPEASTGCSPEPLRNRVQSRLGPLKPKVRDGVLRSQFACTYQDDEPPLKRVLAFPGSGRPPTCERREAAQRSASDSAAKPASSKSPNETQSGARPGNAAREPDPRGEGDDATRHHAAENEPPERRRRPAGASARRAGRAPSKKKLMAGQGKITSFFRV